MAPVLASRPPRSFAVESVLLVLLFAFRYVSALLAYDCQTLLDLRAWSETLLPSDRPLLNQLTPVLADIPDHLRRTLAQLKAGNSRRKFTYIQPPDAGPVSSVWSAALPVASRTRHQCTAIMVRNIAGNIARLRHAVYDGRRGVDLSLLRPIQSIISMDISNPSPLPKPKRDIYFRNTKNINPAILYSDLKLLASVNHPSVNKSVEHYNYSLHCLLDTHAPLKTRTVSFSRSAPWFTDELRKMKAGGRAIERRVKSSGLVVHKLAYKHHQKAYAAALKQARSIYYSNIINSPGNSKQLFSTINHLLNTKNQTHTEPTAELCNRFLVFFKDKINSIRSQLSGSPAPSLPSACSQPPLFSIFTTVIQIEAEGLIKKDEAFHLSPGPLPYSTHQIKPVGH
ncbi:unnamed protein product [Leuciscus chuanchicus]